MNFLALVIALKNECGVTGTDPTDVTGLTGELNRLVNWINQAWLDIQNAHPDWRWMRTSTSVGTTASDDTYATSEFSSVTNFSEWLTDTFRCYLTATGRSDEQFLVYLPYDQWRDYYDFGSQTTVTERPQHFTVAPNNDIRLGPIPNGAYTITGDYQKSASSLSVKTDEPGLPSQFHYIIVYRAMISYALYESAPEVLARGRGEFNRWMSRLETNQLPQISIGAPLVA